MQECVGCLACAAECPLLKEFGRPIFEVPLEEITYEKAFACLQCGLCAAACPVGLDPSEPFRLKRRELVENGIVNLEDYSYLFPDEAANTWALCREIMGIDYEDIVPAGATPAVFFPGCTIATYSPLLTRACLSFLQRISPGAKAVIECCGKPLRYMGLDTRADRLLDELGARLREWQVSRVVVACPNCFYELAERIGGPHLEVVDVYSLLYAHRSFLPANSDRDSLTYTIHDVCPDRYKKIFGKQVRALLEYLNIPVREMRHQGRHTVCCGSGGMAKHFVPSAGAWATQLRVEEAAASGARGLLTYCMSCLFNLADHSQGMPVVHALSLILNVKDEALPNRRLCREALTGS